MDNGIDQSAPLSSRHYTSRRALLRLAAYVSGGLGLTLLQACAPSASAPSPTAAPAAKATTAPAPAAPTTAPTAAAKPTTAATTAPATGSPAAGATAAPAAGAPTAAAAAGPTLAAGPNLTVEMIGQTLPTHLQHKNVDQPYTQDIIPKRSNNRVKINLSTWAEKNLSGNEFIRLLRQRQVDIATGTFTYLSGEVPLLDMADLAGLNPDINQVRKVLAATQPVFNKELERLGVRQIAAYAFPAQVFFLRSAITGLDDLKGKKLRTFGTTLNDLVVALGAQAVSITFAEVYSSLERGVVDGAITGTATGNTTKWFEVTSHLLNLPLAWAPGGYYVALDWWNGLQPDVQKFLEASLTEMATKQTDLAAEITQDGVDCNAGRTCKQGVLNSARPMTEIKPSDADRAKLRTILEEAVIPAWVKRAGEPNGEIYNQVVAPISGVKWVKR